jgi:preprotein translocase subunit YajC
MMIKKMSAAFLPALLSPAAYAQSGAAAPQENIFVTFAPLVVIFALFYFLLIRPQQKRARQHREMLTALKIGDEVITAGGIIGKVVKIADNYVSLEVGEKMEIRFQKQAMQTVLPRGTIKSI